MKAASALHAKNPERVCWGCDKLCPAENLACGNGTIRSPHPSELFGEDWLEWEEQRANRIAATLVAQPKERNTVS